MLASDAEVADCSASNSVNNVPGADQVDAPPRPRIVGTPPPLGPFRGPGLARLPRPILIPRGPEFIRSGRPIVIPPFFIREIYKNGFLKKISIGDKKERNPLMKLLKSGRYWGVFSVHDDAHPFLELFQEPAHVATHPPVMAFPLESCMHISESILGQENEFTFFIKFKSNDCLKMAAPSHQQMKEWVDIMRMRLTDLGILKPKDNVYTKTPQGRPVRTSTSRDPTSPLPQPPTESDVANANDWQTSKSLSSEGTNHSNTNVDDSLNYENDMNNVNNNVFDVNTMSDTNKNTFTTIVNLNQTPPTKSKNKSYQNVKNLEKTESETLGKESNASKVLTAESLTPTNKKSTVYLGEASPCRHVTVIPINKSSQVTVSNNSSDDVQVVSPRMAPSSSTNSLAIPVSNKIKGVDAVEVVSVSPPKHVENQTYETIFDSNDVTLAHSLSCSPPVSNNALEKFSSLNQKTVDGHQLSRSPPKVSNTPKYDSSVLESRENVQSTSKKFSSTNYNSNNSEHIKIKQRYTSDNSSESIGSVFAQEFEKSCKVSIPVVGRKKRRQSAENVADRGTSRRPAARSRPTRTEAGEPSSPGEVCRRSSSLGPILDAERRSENSLELCAASTNSLESIDSNPRQAPSARRPPRAFHFDPHFGVTERETSEPRSHLRLVQPSMGPSPHLPLPIPVVIPPLLGPQMSFTGQTDERQMSLREHQVMTLRTEIQHPAGLSILIRKRYLQNSLALVEFFGSVWVSGWKQKDFPILYNAFHIGDQIVSVVGVKLRNVSDFYKAIKTKQNDVPVEIILRRIPCGQAYYLKRDMDGQNLGIAVESSGSEIKEITSGSLAARAGITSKVRGIEGQLLCSWMITEINGKPLNLFSKDGEARNRLAVSGRDISIVIQPQDFVNRLKKNLKTIKSYKEYLIH